MTPPDTGVMDRTIGYTVSSSNRSTAGCEGYGGIATGSDGSLLRPLTSTTMSLPASIPQSCSNADEVRERRASGRVGGSSRNSSAPAALQIVADHVDLVRREVDLRSGNHDDRGFRRDRLLLQQAELFDLEVVDLEHLRDAGVAGPAIASGRVTLAVPLDEVHGLFLALHGLDERVRQILFGIGRRALDARAVLEHDRAFLLNLVLVGEARPLVDVDVFDVDLLRDVLELDRAIAEPVEVFALREDLDGDGIRQRLEDFLVCSASVNVPPAVKSFSASSGGSKSS